MKRNISIKLLIFVSLILLLPANGFARDIAPVVSTDWLLANLNNPKLVILDVRRVEEYREGHIPGAVSSFYGAWAYMKDGMFSSLPEKDDIDDTIAYFGIDSDKWIVVTGCMDTPRLSYQSARVACTLQYAGIENVALLDGGMNKWLKEKKPLSTKVERRKRRTSRKIFGEKFRQKRPQAKPGQADSARHPRARIFSPVKKNGLRSLRPIPGAFNMPTSCAYNEDKPSKLSNTGGNRRGGRRKRPEGRDRHLLRHRPVLSDLGLSDDAGSGLHERQTLRRGDAGMGAGPGRAGNHEQQSAQDG
jgi:thiosulfate/3-mercaptopyruvate sulfurtransferase